MICALSWPEGLRILLALGLDPIPGLKKAQTYFYKVPDAMREFVEYRCFCSTSGCVPAAVLVRKERMGYVVRRLVAEIFTKAYPSSARRASMREICRLEVFERFRMTHTCCRQTMIDNDHLWSPLDHDNAAAIHGEEMELKVALEAYMERFDDLLTHFSGRFTAFTPAWWAAIDLFFSPQYRQDDIICDGSEKS
ncbi:hypothetical protein BKA80DRAFT_65629 [Phyllosticta citrichinensis]